MICDEIMMCQKVDYIHQNPVKRGFVDEVVHWRYSSARNYLGYVGLLHVCTDWNQWFVHRINCILLWDLCFPDFRHQRLPFLSNRCFYLIKSEFRVFRQFVDKINRANHFIGRNHRKVFKNLNFKTRNLSSLSLK